MRILACLLDTSALRESSRGCIVLVVSSTLVEIDALARVGTALADPTRRRILLSLLSGPAYPAELADALNAGRTNVSNHLGCLRGCGLVRAVREGRNVRYELSSAPLASALRELVHLELAVDAAHDDLDGRD